ncbi:MAG: tetratricopeptide repeat protein [Chloroflexota bacterium]
MLKQEAISSQGLSLAEANGLTVQQYRQQANLGEAAMLRGQFREANAHYQQALAMVRAPEFASDLCVILNQAGENFIKQDAYAEAENHFNEALQLAQEKGFVRTIPFSFFGLAKVARATGNVVEARKLGEQSRQQLLAIGNHKAKEVWWWLKELSSPAVPD